MTKSQKGKVLNILKEFPKSNTPTQIEDRYEEKYGKEVGNIYTVLNRMKRNGYIKKPKHGQYTITDAGEKALNREDRKTVNEFDAGTIAQIEARSDEDDIYDWLAANLCPNMMGNEDIRLACLASALSTPDTTKRNRVHVLISGPYGTGKTDILRSLSKVFYGEYVPLDSDTGTSSGLRGSVKGNEVQNEGALIRNSGNTIYINELDNVGKSQVQDALTSAMQEGQIVFNMGNKEGEKRDAETRVIASCNDKNKVKDMILSRFDLKFKTSRMNKKEKQDYAEDIVLSWDREIGINRDLFSKYLRYAKKHDVKLPDREGRDFIVGTIQREIKHGSLKGAGPREINTVPRLSKALARLKLDDVVKEEHVKKAIELIEKSE